MSYSETRKPGIRWALIVAIALPVLALADEGQDAVRVGRVSRRTLDKVDFGIGHFSYNGVVYPIGNVPNGIPVLDGAGKVPLAALPAFASSPVISVAGRAGVVTLTTSDVVEASNLYFSNARVIAAPLTGFTAGAGTVSAADSVLSALQKHDAKITTNTSGITANGTAIATETSRATAAEATKEPTIATGTSGYLFGWDKTWKKPEEFGVLKLYTPSSFAGADLTAKCNAAIAAMPSGFGGDLDLRDPSFSGTQSIGTLAANGKPLRILVGHGNRSMAALTINNAKDVEIIGDGANVSTITTPANAAFITFTGSYSTGNNVIYSSGVSYVSGGGTSQIIKDTGVYPGSVTGFGESHMIFENCFVSGYTGAYPFQFGDSFYYVKIQNIEAHGNRYFLEAGRYSDTYLHFIKGVSVGMVHIRDGSNTRLDNMSFVPGGQATDSVWIDPVTNGSGGKIMIGPNMEFGPEGEIARSVADGVTTNGSTTITSATANFTSADVGLHVEGTNIPDGAMLASVTNSTTAVISIAATASGSSQAINLARYALSIRSSVNSGFVTQSLIFHDNIINTNVAGRRAIDYANPIRDSSFYGNTFDGMKYAMKDHPAYAISGESAGNNAWFGNTVTVSAASSTTDSSADDFEFGGVSFDRVEKTHMSATDPITPVHKTAETPYIGNRIAWSDDFSHWLSNGVAIAGGQTDSIGDTDTKLTRSGSALHENIHLGVSTGAIGSVGALSNPSRGTLIFKARSDTLGFVQVNILDSAGLIRKKVVPLGPNNQWYSVTAVRIIPGNIPVVYFYPGGDSTSPATAGSIYISHVQFFEYDCNFVPTAGTAIALPGTGSRFEREIVAASGVSYPNQGSTPSTPTTGNKIFSDNSGNLSTVNSGGVVSQIGPFGGTLSHDLTLSPSNTYNILGAHNITALNSILAPTFIANGGSGSGGTTIAGGVTTDGSVVSSTTVSAGSTVQTQTFTGAAVSGTDTASTAVTIRSGASTGSGVGGDIRLATSNAGTTGTSSNAQTIKWKVDGTTGDLRAGTDATYDIGSGSLRPRDITASRNLTLGGYAELDTQGSAPATPGANNLRMFSDASGRLSWKRSDGFLRIFDSTLTADRTYTWPNASGTVVMDSASQTVTNKTIDGGSNTLTNIAASSLAASVPRIVARTTDSSSVTSSTTLANDDTLLIPVAASHTYFFQAYLKVNAANNVMDVKFGWSVPTGTTMAWGAEGTNGNNASAFAWTITTSGPVGLATESGSLSEGSANNGTGGYILSGTITTSSTAGNVNLQWAQNTSDAGALKLLAGSHIRYYQLF